MMHRFVRVTAASLISIIASVAAAKADESPPSDASSGFALAASTLSPPAESWKAASKAAFTNATPAVRVAPCGVEADAGNSNLDAGLIDFNVPDPARAAGRSFDDQRDVGRNVGDYHSTVILGVTLGYHF